MPSRQRRVSCSAYQKTFVISRITEALVQGNEALMGVLPLEAMEVLVDPLRQELVVNPEHPNYPVALAK